MNILNFVKNGLLKVNVIPNSSRDELKKTDGGLRLYLKAMPEKGKANKAVIKFFKKEFSVNAEIKSGEKSREKVLRIIR